MLTVGLNFELPSGWYASQVLYWIGDTTVLVL